MPRALHIGLTMMLALALLPFPALASEWWYVNSGANRVLFVDAQSIARKGNIVTYWTMYVIRPGEPEVMTKSHMRADCRKRRLGALQLFQYDEAGRQIGDAQARPAPMGAAPPDSLGDAEFRFACGDEGYRVTNDLFPLAIDEATFAEALIAHGNKPDDAHSLHEAIVARQTHAALVPHGEEKVQPGVVASPADTPQSAPDGDTEETRQLEKSCNAGTTADCALLGTRLTKGEDVPKDEARAAIFFDKACIGGDADSCTLLGIAYHAGNGVTRNAERSAAAFARACEKGGPSTCGNFGLALVNGDGVAKDVARAFGYFTAACKSGIAASCSSLGASYSMGVGTKAKPQRARRLFQKACDGHDPGGCYNLGVVFDQGLGVRKDPVRAASLYEGACDQDDGAACGNLGTLVQNGRGIAQDPVRAGELFRKACDLEDADGCLNLGRAYQAGSGVTRDLDQAATFFRRALAIEPDKADARRALSALKPD
jgi:TPR repeat protein